MTPLQSAPEQRLTILMPVFNDWQSFVLLVRRIDDVLAAKSVIAHVVAVNDGSTLAMSLTTNDIAGLQAVRRISIVHLTRNMGHQRAIAAGLSFLEEEHGADAVVVMDSDGEDKPDDVAALLEASTHLHGKIIFAARAKRSEGAIFRFFYIIYKRLYHLLTGSAISFGNFSIVPAELLPKLVSVSEIWTHYSAGVLKSRLPIATIPTSRGKRLAGESKMNFVSLVLHGLSGIAVHLDVVSVRLLLMSGILSLLVLCAIPAIFVMRLYFHSVPMGWASNVLVGLLVVLMQTVLLSLFLVFMILNSRAQQIMFARPPHNSYILKVETLL